MVRSRSIIATPPGATIKEQLNDRGMSQKEFAVRIDMSEKHVSKLINGEVQLTPEVAVRLEIVLGVPARFWNNLEAIYREKLIKIAAEKAMDADENLVRQFPYSEMAKLGWIPQTRNYKEKVINLRKYFEVVSLSFLQGTTFIDGNKIVVGLTARGKDADVWSRDELILLEAFKMFKEKQNFSVASVKRFAKENRIAPGIVVGRLQNEGCIEYNMLNELKEHYVITV